MKRLLGLLLAACLAAGATDAEAQKPARMNETGWDALGAPAGCAAGYVPYVNADLKVVCSPTVYAPTTDTLTVGTLNVRNLKATALPASGAITVEPKLSPLGGITVVGAGWRANGLLTVVGGADLLDGETFVLADGTNIPQSFEFDLANDGVLGGHVEIDIAGTETPAEVGALCAAAIDATTSGTFTYDAIDNLDGTVALWNTTWGATGNTPQSETVAAAGFAVTAMAGGADGVIEGDGLVVGDGVGVVPIEFDAAPGDGTTGGAVPIVFDGTETATQIRDAVKAILDASGRDWITSNQGADGIGLVRATPGASGGAITEAVADAGFGVNDWTAPTAATTYTYSLQACLADGSCNAAGPASTTAAGVLTLSGYNLNRLSWSAVSGAASYKIRRDVGGATQGVIWTGTALTVDDAGLAGDGSAPPTTDGTGTLTGRGVLARGSTVAVGTGTATAAVGGVLHVNTTAQATTGTTLEALATYTLPANTLSANGKAIRITFWGVHAANTNSAGFQLRFGGISGTILWSASSSANGAGFSVTAVVVRTGASTQTATAIGGTGSAGTFMASAPTQTLSNPIDIVVAGLTAAAAGDVTFSGLIVEALN